MRLRAVELNALDVPKAAEFLEQTWGLADAGKRGNTRYWRGTGDHPYILSLTPSTASRVATITFPHSRGERERSRPYDMRGCGFDAPGGGPV